MKRRLSHIQSQLRALDSRMSKAKYDGDHNKLEKLLIQFNNLKELERSYVSNIKKLSGNGG